MKRRLLTGLLAVVMGSTVACRVQSSSDTASPHASHRPYEQNYKDMVLATCLSTAYQRDERTAADIGSSVSALREWTYYDLEKSPDSVRALVTQYLNRNYANPLAESEIVGIRFDFLKCLDLYHGEELEDLAGSVVIDPARTFRRDVQGSGH